MKKIILFLMLFLSVGLVSCAGNNANNEYSDDEDVSITFMHMWPEHEDAIKGLVNDFKKLHPNIDVKIQITPYQYMEETLQTSYISGDMPNVYVFYTHYMTPLVSSSDGVMAGSLNDVYENVKDTYLTPDSWNLANVNGNFYSAPFRTTAEIVFFNKTLFDEKGWTKPTTFEQFEELIETINEDGKYVPLAAGGKENQINYVLNALTLFCSILDGSVEEPGYKVGRLEPTSDITNAVLAYDKVKNWYQNEYFGKGAIATTKSGAIAQFTNKKAAMVFANICNLGDISSVMPNVELDAFAIPAPSALGNSIKYVYGGYDGLSYSPNASPAEITASKMLIEYLISAEAQQKLVDQTQSIAVVKDVVYHDEAYNKFAKECSFVGAYANVTDYMTGANSAKNPSIIATFISGTSGKSAKEIIELVNSNVYKDMQDLLLNDPKVDWYPREKEIKPFDNNWLK